MDTAGQVTDPSSARPLAVLAAGTGRYADPWHPFAAVADALARTLEGDGWRTRREDDLDAALSDLSDARLLVVAAGDPWRNGETGRGAPPAAARGLRAALARGIGVLAIHNAVSSLRDYPEWRRALGGGWRVGTSWHPPRGRFTVTVVPGHPAAPDAEEFEVDDERYTDLDVDPDVRVLAVHRDGEHTHPLVWAREDGASRIVVDALGHDPASWDAPAHRALTRSAARWAGRR